MEYLALVDVICISCKDITTFTIKTDHMIKMRLYFTAKIHIHMNLQSNKPSAQMLKRKENESKQKRRHEHHRKPIFMGAFLIWVWSKRCQSEPQAAEAAQRDHAYDDCKSKDKQTQDLQHKNESIITTRNEYQTTHKYKARHNIKAKHPETMNWYQFKNDND
eukprot:730003_1